MKKNNNSFKYDHDMWVFIIYVNKQVKVLRNSNLQRGVAALTKTGKEENDNYCFRVSTNECSTYRKKTTS